MKEKIDRLSRGIFEYELPEPIVSEDVLNIVAEAGKQVKGTFTVSNCAGTRMKGILYVTGRRLKLDSTNFIGTKCEFSYSVDASLMEEGEHYKGAVNIVSDCGEFVLPFQITVVAPECKTSIGQVRDLFQFANLARFNWEEAENLFVSPEFSRVLSGREPKYRTAYEQLVQSPSKGQALEQFLVLIRKKKKCLVSVSVPSLEFEAHNENFMERIVITKETWGYAELSVMARAPFLRLSTDLISNGAFENGRAELGVMVDASALKEGNHYGEIVLHSTMQTIQIPVICRCSRESSERRRQGRLLKRYESKLLEQYLAFRNGRISSGAFLAESGKLTDALLLLVDKECLECTGDDKKCALLEEKKNKYELYRVYLNIVDSKNHREEEQLNFLLERKAGYERRDSFSYCAVLYLETMKTRNRTMVADYVGIIRERLAKEPGERMLFWFLLYMDKRLEENRQLRFDAIKEQCGRGCNSPVFYYEAAELLKSDAALVKELSHFEYMTAEYMQRNGMLTKEAALQFACLADKPRVQDTRVLRLLIRIYQKIPHKEVLAAICRKIVRLESKKVVYHEYVRKGIQEQLKIGGLYEAYLATMDMSKVDMSTLDRETAVIDQPVLLYFSYNTTLSKEDTAFLYSYVVRNKDSNAAIYRAYLKKIEQFAVNQLKAGAVSSDLAVIYADVLRKSIIDRAMAQTLPDVIFTCRLVCTNPDMKQVCVAHKEEKEALFVPLERRAALVPVYTENAEVFLLDEAGNRYLLSEEDKLYQLMHGEDFLDACYEIGSDNRRLLLHIGEKNSIYNRQENGSLELQKQLSHMHGLRETVQNDYAVAMADYYYDNYEGELLEACLNEVNLRLLPSKKRVHMMELMIIRDMYEKVMEAVGVFGCEHLSAKRLAKLCVQGIHSGREEADREVLLFTGFFAFQNGRVDDRLLRYLADGYNGTTQEMCELWRVARERELDTASLEERLLGQILFTESFVEDSFAVFLSYYRKGLNRKLIRAYLSYSAYKYFIRDRVTDPELFEILKKEPFLENSQICTLALLKYYAGKEELTDEEKAFAQFHIRKLGQKKMIFPFFEDFEGRVLLPAYMEDKYYIEYRTNPRKKVILNYTHEENGMDFRTEPMEDTGYGIHVKGVVLFFGETLQYCIIEEDEDGTQQVTESHSIRYEETDRGSETSKYGKINEILMTKDLKDEKTLLALLEQYYQEEYAVKWHFSPV